MDDLNHWVRALVINGDKMYVGIYQAIKIFDIPTFESKRIIDINGINCVSNIISSFIIK